MFYLISIRYSGAYWLSRLLSSAVAKSRLSFNMLQAGQSCGWLSISVLLCINSGLLSESLSLCTKFCAFSMCCLIASNSSELSGCNSSGLDWGMY